MPQVPEELQQFFLYFVVLVGGPLVLWVVSLAGLRCYLAFVRGIMRIANIIVGADTDTLGMEKENNTQHWVSKPIYDHVSDCLKRQLANRKVFDKYYYNSKINNNFWTDDLRPLVKMEHARALMYEANNPHYYRQEVIPPAMYVAHGFYESGRSHDHSENNIVLFYEGFDNVELGKSYRKDPDNLIWKKYALIGTKYGSIKWTTRTLFQRQLNALHAIHAIFNITGDEDTEKEIKKSLDLFEDVSTVPIKWQMATEVKEFVDANQEFLLELCLNNHIAKAVERSYQFGKEKERPEPDMTLLARDDIFKGQEVFPISHRDLVRKPHDRSGIFDEGASGQEITQKRITEGRLTDYEAAEPSEELHKVDKLAKQQVDTHEHERLAKELLAEEDCQKKDKEDRRQKRPYGKANNKPMRKATKKLSKHLVTPKRRPDFSRVKSDTSADLTINTNNEEQSPFRSERDLDDAHGVTAVTDYTDKEYTPHRSRPDSSVVEIASSVKEEGSSEEFPPFDDATESDVPDTSMFAVLDNNIVMVATNQTRAAGQVVEEIASAHPVMSEVEKSTSCHNIASASTAETPLPQPVTEMIHVVTSASAQALIESGKQERRNSIEFIRKRTNSRAAMMAPSSPTAAANETRPVASRRRGSLLANEIGRSKLQAQNATFANVQGYQAGTSIPTAVSKKHHGRQDIVSSHTFGDQFDSVPTGPRNTPVESTQLRNNSRSTLARVPVAFPKPAIATSLTAAKEIVQVALPIVNQVPISGASTNPLSYSFGDFAVSSSDIKKAGRKVPHVEVRDVQLDAASKNSQGASTVFEREVKEWTCTMRGGEITPTTCSTRTGGMFPPFTSAGSKVLLPNFGDFHQDNDVYHPRPSYALSEDMGQQSMSSASVMVGDAKLKKPQQGGEEVNITGVPFKLPERRTETHFKLKRSKSAVLSTVIQGNAKNYVVVPVIFSPSEVLSSKAGEAPRQELVKNHRSRTSVEWDSFRMIDDDCAGEEKVENGKLDTISNPDEESAGVSLSRR